MNIDFGAAPGFSAYVLLLMFSGVAMIVMASPTVKHSTNGLRALNALFGVGFLGYGFYLAFLFNGGGYFIFFKASPARAADCANDPHCASVAISRTARTGRWSGVSSAIICVAVLVGTRTACRTPGCARFTRRATGQALSPALTGTGCPVSPTAGGVGHVDHLVEDLRRCVDRPRAVPAAR